jgi:hypothetical protein
LLGAGRLVRMVNQLPRGIDNDFLVSILRGPGHSGYITPSVAKQPSPGYHDRSFARFDEILYLVEKASVLTLARHGESKA